MFDGNFAVPPANKPKISVAAPISFRKVQPSQGQLIIGGMPEDVGVVRNEEIQPGFKPRLPSLSDHRP